MDPLLSRIAAQKVRVPSGPHEAAILSGPKNVGVIVNGFRNDRGLHWRCAAVEQRACNGGNAWPVARIRRHVLCLRVVAVSGEHEVAAGRMAVDVCGHRTDDRHVVRHSRCVREMLAEVDAGHRCRDRSKVSADLEGRIRFRIEGFVLGRSAGKKNDDARLGLAECSGPCGALFRSHHGRQ